MELLSQLGTTLVAAWGTLKILLVTYGLAMVVERAAPAERNQSLANLAANVQYTVVYVFLSAVLVSLLRPLGSSLIAMAGGSPHIPLPADGSLLVKLGQNLLWFFVFDFFYYWHHRLQHKVGGLWHIHKVHHSDVGLNATTTEMHHWLEEPMRVLTITIPMGLVCDLKPVDIGILTVILNLWGTFIHTNVRLDMGIFTPVFAGPQYHRVHHSNLPEHSDKNFAAFFPFYDIVFRTYHRPKPGEFPTTGLHTGEVPASLLERMIWPFQGWAADLARLRGQKRAAATPAAAE